MPQSREVFNLVTSLTGPRGTSTVILCHIPVFFHSKLYNQRKIFSHDVEMNNKGILHFYIYIFNAFSTGPMPISSLIFHLAHAHQFPHFPPGPCPSVPSFSTGPMPISSLIFHLAHAHQFPHFPPSPCPSVPSFSTWPMPISSLIFHRAHAHQFPHFPPGPCPSVPSFSTWPMPISSLIFHLAHAHQFPHFPPGPCPSVPSFSTWPMPISSLIFHLAHAHQFPHFPPGPCPSVPSFPIHDFLVIPPFLVPSTFPSINNFCNLAALTMWPKCGHILTKCILIKPFLILYLRQILIVFSLRKF